jgi:ribose 5-phosphate isomerase A
LFSTDGGNRILDCRFGAIADPESLDRTIGQTVGVVETGLFIGMAEVALIADAAGVRAIRRSD